MPNPTKKGKTVKKSRTNTWRAKLNAEGSKKKVRYHALAKPPPVSIWTAHAVPGTHGPTKSTVYQRAQQESDVNRIMRKIDAKEVNSKLPWGSVSDTLRDESLLGATITINQVYSMQKHRKALLLQSKKEASIQEINATALQRRIFKQEKNQKAGMPVYDPYDSDNQSFHSKDSVIFDFSKYFTVGKTAGRSGGRKHGSTKESKMELDMKCKRFVDDVCRCWALLVNNGDDDMRLWELIQIKNHQYGLHNYYLSEWTVWSTVHRNKLTDARKGQQLPIKHIEPLLCHLLKFASRMGTFMSQHCCISLLNKLIAGVEYEERMKNWYDKHVIKCMKVGEVFNDDDSRSYKVGLGWLSGL